VGDDRINDARDVRKSKRGMTHLGSWVVDSGFVDFFPPSFSSAVRWHCLRFISLVN